VSGKTCKRCGWHKEGRVGIVVYVPGVAVFEVDRAELLTIRRPRKPVTIPHRLIGRYVQPDQVEAEHVPHVDASKPVIIAQVSHVKGVRRVLIEGRHRATQCLYAGRDLKAYLLTPAETKLCIGRKLTPPGRARKKR
jgi:hypothetical protein